MLADSEVATSIPTGRNPGREVQILRASKRALPRCPVALKLLLVRRIEDSPQLEYQRTVAASNVGSAEMGVKFSINPYRSCPVS
jgi:hypothetical protein